MGFDLQSIRGDPAVSPTFQESDVFWALFMIGGTPWCAREIFGDSFVLPWDLRDVEGHH